PYIRGEMANGWQNTLSMMSGKNGHWWGGLKALTAPLNLLVNYVPQWTRNLTEYRQLGAACLGWVGAFVVINLLSAVVAELLRAGIDLEIRRASRDIWRAPRQVFSQAPGVIFLGIVTAVPLICYLFSRQSFHRRYSIVLLPPLLAL